jgi:hypothetical protein
MSINPLDGDDVRERAAAASAHDVQLEPWNIVRRSAGRAAELFAGESRRC